MRCGSIRFVPRRSAGWCVIVEMIEPHTATLSDYARQIRALQEQLPAEMEANIRALPLEEQAIMARLCLSGWKFQRNVLGNWDGRVEGLAKVWSSTSLSALLGQVQFWGTNK